MNWIQRQWQKLRQLRPAKPSPTTAKTRVAVKQRAIQKTVQPAAPKGNLVKARQQALQVDRELFKKGITINRGKHVTKIDPPTAVPNSGWKPKDVPPSRGRQRGKSMRP